MNLKKLVAVALLASAWALPAFAHAHPEKTTPKQNAVLTAPPAAVSIWFDDDIQPALSRIEVKLDGQVVSKGKAKGDAKNAKLLSVPLAKAHAGKYTVTWHALADDGHPTTGTFGFTVKAAAH